MTCNPEARDRLRRAGDALDALDCVVDTTLVEPGDGTGWQLDILFQQSARGVPPAALEELAAAGVSLPAVARQGGHPTAVAV